MGITKKHFISLSATLALIALFFLGISYFALPIYYNQSQKQELKNNFVEVVAQLQQQSTDQMVPQLKTMETETGLFFSLARADGSIFYPSPDVIAEYETDSQSLAESEDSDIGVWTDTVISNDGEPLILTGQYTYPSLTNISQTLLTLYPFIILLFSVIAGIAAWIYSRFSTKRIRSISVQTREMQTLKKGIFCQVTGQDEISRLAQDINTLYTNLLDSIEELEQENQRTLAREQEKIAFLRMTSHELKTPITSMMGMIEGMLYQVGDFKDRDKYLRLCLNVLEEQGQIVHSILEASKLDLLLKPNQDTFSLKELLDDLLPTYEGLAQVRTIDFHAQLSEARIKGHKLYLQKALKNILDNAFRYTKSEGQILLILTETRLTLANQAEQLLTPEQLTQIYQPFYRPDFSRNREDGGTGLGLYIVSQILDKHGFDYAFKRQEEDMVFSIDFTKALVQSQLVSH